MANFLPILLIGGAAAYVVASGKKKGGQRFKHLRIGPGCKKVYLGGKDFFQTIQESKDEAVRQEILENMSLFWKEDLFPLIEKINPDTSDITIAKIHATTGRLVKAGAPSCYVSQQALIRTLKKKLENVKTEKDLEDAILPLLGKLIVRVLIQAGYEIYLIKNNLMKDSELSDYENKLKEMLPPEMGWISGEEEPPEDPNQMAAMRPGIFTEGVLMTLQGY